MEIVFNLENIEKCLCSKCMVHEESECIKDKTKLLQEKALSSSLVGPEEFPALYCAFGKEECNDLNRNEKCRCPDCSIYLENELEFGGPSSYFCLDGHSIKSKNMSDSEDLIRINDMLRDYYLRRD